MKGKWYSSWLISLTAGSLLGAVFGLQQSTSVVLSSFHDLPSFPVNSLWAIILNIFLAQLIFCFLGIPFGVAIGYLLRRRRSKDLILMPASFGLAFGMVVSFFFLGRFAGVIHKKAVIFLIVLIGAVSGLVVGFFFFTFIWWQKRKKIWFWFWRVLVIGGLASFAFSFLFTTGLAVHRYFYGVSGFAKQSVVRTEATLDKPNIVFITLDALRADHLGTYGYQKEITPNLDKLAQQGVVFENAFVNAPWTFPSFASMMTSRYPTELDTSIDELSSIEIMNKGRLIEAPETIAERLETLGYQTQAVVTNGWLVPKRGFPQGFTGYAHVENLMPYHYKFHFQNSALAFLLNQIPGIEKNLERFYDFLFGPAWQHLRTPAFKLTPWVNGWLEEHQNHRFFLWVHLIDPHNPYDPAPRFTPELEEPSPGRVQQLREISARDPEQIRWREVDRQALIALYDGDISQGDFGVGQLWQRLNELGLTEKTILIISADHGEEFWDHGGMGHGRTFYQETIRVPLIILGPGIGPRRVTQNVSLLDLFPTIIDLIGEKTPQGALGRSLKPLIEGKYLPDEPVIAEANSREDKARAIIWGNYKLIHNYFTDEEKLYNLRTDPQEKINLIDLQPGIAYQLHQRLFAVVDQSEKNRQELFQKPEPSGPPLGDVVGY